MWFYRPEQFTLHCCRVQPDQPVATVFTVNPQSYFVSFHVCIVYVYAGFPSLSPLSSPSLCCYDENDRLPSGVVGKGITVKYLCAMQC